MCLIFVAIHQHPDYPLIVAGNRDEFFQRPTKTLHHWSDSPIIAGKDLTGGGTWLGITKTGRFAALTNFRDPIEQVANPKSRGQIVKDYLAGNHNTSDYLAALETETRFPGFNLLAGQHEQLWYFSNRANHPPQPLKAGIYGLSNHLLDTPWPKVKYGKAELAALLSTTPQSDTLINEIFDLLNQRKPAADRELPHTGVGQVFEKQLSARFIQAPNIAYGTRCSSVVLMDINHQYTVIEQNWNAQGDAEELITVTA